MNYYEPKQRKSDGKWDYTRNGCATGYCHTFKPFEKEFVEQFHISDREVEKHNSFADKYHADGHDSADEACECYKQYQLDHTLQLDHEDVNQQRKCEVCGEWTTKFAMLDCSLFHLCDEHRTREEVEKLYSASTFSMSSW